MSDPNRRIPAKSGPRGPRPLRPVAVVDGKIIGPDLLSLGEVAHLLGLRRETVWAWGRRGLLRGVRVGTLLRYPRQRVEALLSESTSEAVSA